jgi:hypothetical protein
MRVKSPIWESPDYARTNPKTQALWLHSSKKGQRSAKSVERLRALCPTLEPKNMKTICFIELGIPRFCEGDAKRRSPVRLIKQ